MESLKLNNHFTVYHEDGYTCYKYYNTIICKVNDDECILNSGNWRTNSTKKFINRILNYHNFNVQIFQKNFNWYTKYSNRVCDFIDNIIIFKEL